MAVELAAPEFDALRPEWPNIGTEVVRLCTWLEPFKPEWENIGMGVVRLWGGAEVTWLNPANATLMNAR